MRDATSISLKNRTGLQMSPAKSRKLLEAANGVTTPGTPDPEHEGLATVRAEYIAEGEPLGTIPAPLSAKGMLKSAARMLAGDRLQVLMDKLSERSAFERGGTRLYDALLLKHRELGNGKATGPGKDAAGNVSREALLEIRNQEAEHFQLVSECIRELGGDPTAETPCADVVGVQTLGLIQTVTDPRTSLTQSLSAILTAELADVAGWELLAELAETLGQDAMADRFRIALRHEQQHLLIIRGWYRALVLAESGNPGAVSRPRAG